VPLGSRGDTPWPLVVLEPKPVVPPCLAMHELFGKGNLVGARPRSTQRESGTALRYIFTRFRELSQSVGRNEGSNARSVLSSSASSPRRHRTAIGKRPGARLCSSSGLGKLGRLVSLEGPGKVQCLPPERRSPAPPRRGNSRTNELSG
jgi:hypothetical protein